MQLRPETDWINPDRHCFTVAETGSYYVDIIPMIYNHRLVLTPKAAPETYDVGWCYPDLLTAVVAARIWDPADGDPAGFIKRVG